MSNENPIEEVSKGATKGVLEYSEKKLKAVISKFLQGEYGH